MLLTNLLGKGQSVSDHVRDVVAGALIGAGNKISKNKEEWRKVNRPMSVNMDEKKCIVLGDVHVRGVLVGNRQELIAGLEPGAEVSMLHTPTHKYPNYIRVFIGGQEIGSFPDSASGSLAAELLTWINKDNALVKVVSWKRVGGLYNTSRLGIRMTVYVLRRPKLVNTKFLRD